MGTKVTLRLPVGMPDEEKARTIALAKAAIRGEDHAGEPLAKSAGGVTGETAPGVLETRNAASRDPKRVIYPVHELMHLEGDDHWAKFIGGIVRSAHKMAKAAGHEADIDTDELELLRLLLEPEPTDSLLQKAARRAIIHSGQLGLFGEDDGSEPIPLVDPSHPAKPAEGAVHVDLSTFHDLGAGHMAGKINGKIVGLAITGKNAAKARVDGEPLTEAEFQGLQDAIARHTGKKAVAIPVGAMARRLNWSDKPASVPENPEDSQTAKDAEFEKLHPRAADADRAGQFVSKGDEGVKSEHEAIEQQVQAEPPPAPTIPSGLDEHSTDLLRRAQQVLNLDQAQIERVVQTAGAIAEHDGATLTPAHVAEAIQYESHGGIDAYAAEKLQEDYPSLHDLMKQDDWKEQMDARYRAPSKELKARLDSIIAKRDEMEKPDPNPEPEPAAVVPDPEPVVVTAEAPPIEPEPVAEASTAPTYVRTDTIDEVQYALYQMNDGKWAVRALDPEVPSESIVPTRIFPERERAEAHYDELVAKAKEHAPKDDEPETVQTFAEAEPVNFLDLYRTAKVGDQWPDGFTVVDINQGFGKQPDQVFIAQAGADVGLQLTARGISGTGRSVPAVNHEFSHIQAHLAHKSVAMTSGKRGKVEHEVMWMTRLDQQPFESLEAGMDAVKGMSAPKMETPPPAPAPEPIPTVAADPAPEPAAEAPAPSGEGVTEADYIDAGEHLEGSRKDMAAMRQAMLVRQREVDYESIDWDALEANPVQAHEVIKRDNLMRLQPSDMRDAGATPGAAYMAHQILSTVTQYPPDSPDARKGYARSLYRLQSALANCKTTEQVKGCVRDLYDEAKGYYYTAEQSEEKDRLTKAFREAWNADYALGKEFAAINHKLDAARSIKTAREKGERLRGWHKEAFPEMAGNKDTKWDGVISDLKVEQDNIIARMEASKAAEKAARKAMDDYVSPIQAAQNADPMSPRNTWPLLGDRFDNVLRNKGAVWETHYPNAQKMEKSDDWTWAGLKKRKAAQPEHPGKPKKRRKKWSDILRVVPEHRIREGGRATENLVTAQGMVGTFNVRGVQYGDWVKNESGELNFHEGNQSDNERASHTQSCAEAFMDLADVLGIDDRTVSLNGRLGIAFGARGRGGKAAAHYERSNMVINLTRFAGAGSLAHEWGHFFDNVMRRHASEWTEGHSGYASWEGADLKTLGPDAEKAFVRVRAAMLHGKYLDDGQVDRYQRALVDIKSAEDRGFEKTANRMRKRLEQTMGGESKYLKDSKDNGKEYWASTHEMFARAFEQWVSDELKASGRRNSYLVSGMIADEHWPDPEEMVYPYPFGDERKAIGRSFRDLFAAVRKANLMHKAAAAAEQHMPAVE